MDLGDGHFGEDFEDFTANATDSNDEDFGVEKRGGMTVDEIEDFVVEGEGNFDHDSNY